MYFYIHILYTARMDRYILHFRIHLRKMYSRDSVYTGFEKEEEYSDSSALYIICVYRNTYIYTNIRAYEYIKTQFCMKCTLVILSILCLHIEMSLYTLTQDAFMYTGWQRLIGSPKSQIIFHKRATKHRSLLRKMTYKDKGSYESSPPCTRGRWTADELLYSAFSHPPMYCVHLSVCIYCGVATIRRLLKIIGLFCKRTL